MNGELVGTNAKLMAHLLNYTGRGFHYCTGQPLA